MGELYDAYFVGRLERFSGERADWDVPLADDAFQIVREGIQISELPDHQRVRPDAEYLLVLCFHEMVLRPAAAVNVEGLHAMRGQLPSDVVTIVRDAAEHTSPGDYGGISGHDVIDSISRTWPHLASMTLLDWEM